MCEACGPELALDQPDLAEMADTGRVTQIANSLGVLAATEATKFAPVAEMTAVCGCGACGVCRTAFAGGVITKAVTSIKSFVAGLRNQSSEA